MAKDQSRLKNIVSVKLAGAAWAAISMATISVAAPAYAQEVNSEQKDKDIVVTGTLIRGSAPVGANEISLGAESFDETGAATANELLASLPQVTNYFNRVPAADLGIAVNQIQISRPNIRNISPLNASSSATLILVDGHRIATAGVNQASVDPDLIPTAAIERVDVVTEGGSAIYGADAVAGVINFRTLRRFNGVEVGGHYGMADNYWQWDGSTIVGKDWGSGSIYAAYSYNKTDALFGRDRDYIQSLNYTSQPYLGLGRECVAPNLAVNTVFTPVNAVIGSVNYALPGLAPKTFNACDNSQNKAIVPKTERHGLLVGFSQDLDDTTTIDIRAYYGQRDTRSSSVLTGSVNVGPSNPYAAGNLPAGVVLGEGVIATRAAVSFSMEPLLGLNSQHNDTAIAQWGVNAELRKDLTDDWQVRGLINWGESDSRYNLTGLSSSRLAVAGVATTKATAFNPFNVVNNDPAMIADLMDNERAGQARDSMINMRLIAEGKLLTLPGGDARIAFGYEFINDQLRQRTGADIRIGTLNSLAFTKYSRNLNSVFGEFLLPILAKGEGDPMLTLSAAGRYDKYSDFGDTFNPKVGATFEPRDWITLRGNWGTSFTAPTPLDQLGAARNTISAFPFVAFVRPGDTPLPGSFTVALQGSRPNLKPQTAETWSVGVELTPVSGFRVTTNYYEVKFEDILGTPTPNAGIFSNFPNNVTTNVAGVSAAQLRDFGLLAPGGTAAVQSLITGGTRVYELVDFRTGNFGVLDVKGIDFTLDYRRETGFGGFDFGINGNYQLSRDAQASSTAAVVDDLNVNIPRYTLQTQIGADFGNFRAQATWNRTDGYDIVPTNSVPVQNKVDGFDVVNLFFKYEVPVESGVLSDLRLTLNVSNVLDNEPPVLRTSNIGDLGFANGFTLGRMFIFGVNKKF